MASNSMRRSRASSPIEERAQMYPLVVAARAAPVVTLRPERSI